MSLLVAGEVAMALTLLIVAGLGIRDLIQLQRLDPGFQTEQILTYSIGLPSVRYDDEESLHALGSALTDRLFPGHALHHYRP